MKYYPISIQSHTLPHTHTHTHTQKRSHFWASRVKPDYFVLKRLAGLFCEFDPCLPNQQMVHEYDYMHQ